MASSSSVEHRLGWSNAYCPSHDGQTLFLRCRISAQTVISQSSAGNAHERASWWTTARVAVYPFLGNQHAENKRDGTVTKDDVCSEWLRKINVKKRASSSEEQKRLAKCDECFPNHFSFPSFSSRYRHFVTWWKERRSSSCFYSAFATVKTKRRIERATLFCRLSASHSPSCLLFSSVRRNTLVRDDWYLRTIILKLPTSLKHIQHHRSISFERRHSSNLLRPYHTVVGPATMSQVKC